MCVRVRKGIARTLALMLSVMLLLELLPGVAKAENVTITISGTAKLSTARATIDEINAFRRNGSWYWNSDNTTKTEIPANTLGDLTYDYDLERIALQRALEIAISFSHTRPNGESYSLIYYNGTHSEGENIAIGIGQMTDAYSAFVAWREDDKPYLGQGHRRSMLESSFTRVGVAHVVVNGVQCHVQEFGRDSHASSPSASENVSSQVTFDGNNRQVVAEIPGSSGCAFSYSYELELPATKAL